MTDLESRLRALPDQLGDVRAGDGLAAAVRDRSLAATRRRRRWVTVTAAAAALVVVGGAMVAGGVLRREAAPTGVPSPSVSPPPAPGSPTDPRLLPWPTRGPLADDDAAVRTAQAAARTLLPGADPGPTHVLWIGPSADGTDRRFAFTQRYLPNSDTEGIHLQWLAGTTANRWTLRGDVRVPADAAGIGLAWSIDTPCPGQGAACPAKTARLLVLGAPDVSSARYRLSDGPLTPVRVTDGVALVTVPVVRSVAYSTGRLFPSVAVTRRGGGEVAAAAPFPVWVPLPPVRPHAAVEWLPPRGLPPLLDAPETFPGLDLWGRLHGLSGRQAYGNPVWGGTLADGSRAVVAQPTIGDSSPYHLVFAVTPRAGDTFLVRDLPNPAEPASVAEVSAYLPLSDGRCELVVVGKPGTTAVGVTEGGRSTELTVRDGVGTLVGPSCAGHDGARITVRAGAATTYQGPVDSTKAGGGVKRG